MQHIEHLDFSAVSILRGYGFVQFMFEADAREAVRMENGGLLKGNKLGTCRCKLPEASFRPIIYVFKLKMDII